MNEHNWTSFLNGVAVLLIAVGLFGGGWILFDRFIMDPTGDSLEQTSDSQASSDGPAWYNPFADKEPLADSVEGEAASQPPGDIEDDFDIGGSIDRDPLPVIGKFESPFVAVAERLKPSVVNILVEGRRMDDQFHRGILTQSGGSGVIVDARGYVLTNHHVVDGADAIIITLSGGEERTGEVIGADPESDLAVVNIGPVEDYRVAELGDSDVCRIGDWAIAMGSPFGLDWTLTVGVISAKGRTDLRIAGGGPVYQDFIQTDASINFG
ncbi:MAG TPA: hypothetical protein ENH10_06875, partial [Bacteroidetes bacterium]|nr:hypothetical protein [Bacteroidota bacterium]HEX04865.1 hypothetical protein [Bacteroidota bacterium]